jgi:hypothetical protein
LFDDISLANEALLCKGTVMPKKTAGRRHQAKASGQLSLMLLTPEWTRAASTRGEMSGTRDRVMLLNRLFSAADSEAFFRASNANGEDLLPPLSQSPNKSQSYGAMTPGPGVR